MIGMVPAPVVGPHAFKPREPQSDVCKCGLPSEPLPAVGRHSSSHHDLRNHLHHVPVFTSYITVGTILADETDVLELGARVATWVVEDVIKDWPVAPLWKYRR